MGVQALEQGGLSIAHVFVCFDPAAARVTAVCALQNRCCCSGDCNKKMSVSACTDKVMLTLSHHTCAQEQHQLTGCHVFPKVQHLYRHSAPVMLRQSNLLTNQFG